MDEAEIMNQSKDCYSLVLAEESDGGERNKRGDKER